MSKGPPIAASVGLHYIAVIVFVCHLDGSRVAVSTLTRMVAGTAHAP